MVFAEIGDGFVIGFVGDLVGGRGVVFGEVFDFVAECRSDRGDDFECDLCGEDAGLVFRRGGSRVVGGEVDTCRVLDELCEGRKDEAI